MESHAAVLSTIEEMTGAFNRQDIEGVMRAYEPGAVVVGEPGAPVTGDAELRAMFADFISAGANFVFDGHEVIAAGDVALHLTPWQMTAARPDGSSVTARGLSVAVLRRQGDGRWLMVIDHPWADAILETARAGRVG